MTRRKLTLLLAGAASLALIGLGLAHAGSDRGERTTAPTRQGLRSVEGRAVMSPEKPRARIEVADPAFRYAGGHRFVLYGVANAEQHVFVDADESGNVHRLYWMQFEGYLPSAPFGRYDYSGSEAKVDISGFSFHADGGWRGADNAPRKGSDGALMRQIVAAAKLKLPANALWQRMVWVDDKQRDELMFIYLEDLAPHELVAADLEPGGKAASRAAAMKQALLSRASAGLQLVRR